MLSTSLNRKTTGVILAAIICTVLLSLSAITLYDHLTVSQRVHNQLAAMTQIINPPLAAILKTGEREFADDIVRSIHASPGILRIALFRRNDDGSYAIVSKATIPSVPSAFSEEHKEPGYLINGSRVLFTAEIKNDVGSVGLLQIEANLRFYRRNIGTTLGIVVPAILLLGALAFGFSRILRRLITRPVLSLVTTAENIRRDNDYSLRAEILSNDEVGRLAKAWNQMMDGIQERDANLARLNRELEERVNTRTNELKTRLNEIEQLMDDLRKSQQTAERTAASLQESNARLTAANIELEAYSYSISHDLKAPLRNLRGFIQLLEQRPSAKSDAELREQVRIIAEEADKMSSMIDGLLSFSRVTHESLRFEEVSLDQLVADVRNELGHELEHRQVIWRIAPLPAVRGDRAALRQAFAHLLHNAVKFTRGRSPATIEIGTAPNTTAANNVTVYVRDNGAGFNPKYAGRLFRVFQRLHSQRDFEGTGIGLASVKNIIARHNGSVWAEGQVDQGATFFLTLKRPPDDWKK